MSGVLVSEGDQSHPSPTKLSRHYQVSEHLVPSVLGELVRRMHGIEV